MKRRAATVAAAVLLLGTSCGDSDIFGFPGPATDEYFPYSPGDTLQFVRTGEGQKRELAYTISGTYSIVAVREVLHEGGFAVVEVVTSGQDTMFTFGLPPEPLPAYSATDYVRVTPFIVEGYRDTISATPAWTVPLPLQMGDIWYYSADSLVEGKVRSLGDIVESPAGTFDMTMLIRLTSLGDSTLTSYTETWFAPGVGPVGAVSFQSTFGAWQSTSDELVRYTAY